jgi:hypothetical protein
MDGDTQAKVNPEKQVGKVQGLIISDGGTEQELEEPFFHDFLFDVYDAVKLIKPRVPVDSKPILRPINLDSI